MKYLKPHNRAKQIIIIIIITPLLASSSHQESPKVYRNLPSLLTDLNNDSLGSPSNFQLSQSPFRALADGSKCAIIIGIAVILMLHSYIIIFFYFFFLARSQFFSQFSFSLIFTLWFAGTSKSMRRQVFCFLFVITRFGLLVGIK